MAKGKGKGSTKPAEPVDDNGEDEEGTYAIAEREPGALHQAFVKWVDDELEEEIDARSVQLAWGLRVAFRKSDFYKNEVVATREAAKAERAAAKAAKEAEEAENGDEDEDSEAKPKRGRRKGGTSQEAVAEANAVTPIKSAGKKSGKSAAKSAPF